MLFGNNSGIPREESCFCIGDDGSGSGCEVDGGELVIDEERSVWGEFPGCRGMGVMEVVVVVVRGVEGTEG